MIKNILAVAIVVALSACSSGSDNDGDNGAGNGTDNGAGNNTDNGHTSAFWVRMMVCSLLTTITK